MFGIPTYLAHKDEREARAADEALHENIAAERAALEREARTKSANRADEACESSNEGTRHEEDKGNRRIFSDIVV